MVSTDAPIATRVLQRQVVWGVIWRFTQVISVITVKSVEEDSTTRQTMIFTEEYTKVWSLIVCTAQSHLWRSKPTIITSRFTLDSMGLIVINVEKDSMRKHCMKNIRKTLVENSPNMDMWLTKYGHVDVFTLIWLVYFKFFLLWSLLAMLKIMNNEWIICAASEVALGRGVYPLSCPVLSGGCTPLFCPGVCSFSLICANSCVPYNSITMETFTPACCKTAKIHRNSTPQRVPQDRTSDRTWGNP